MMDEIESIENQIRNTEENLRLIEERKSQFVMDTNIPMELIKDERDKRNRLTYLYGHRDRLQKGRDVPPLLPYLLNRSYQKFKLGEALKILFNNSYPKPLLCIIHGDQFQCHDTFLECLIKVSLPKILKQNTNITTSDYYTEFIGEYELVWPSTMRSIKELKNMLKHNLANRVLDYGLASKEDINEHLASIGPVIIHTHLLTTDWQQHKSGIIENFLEFWQDWPQLSPNQCLIICLFIKYQVKQNLEFWNWKRRKFQSLNKRIQRSIEDLSSSGFTKFDRITGVVLPELQGIKQGEVESWARSEVIKNYCGEKNIEYLIDTIQDMFEQWEKKEASDAMPMSYLAKNLTNILMGKMIVKEDLA